MIKKAISLERVDIKIITIFFLLMFFSDFLIKYINVYNPSFYYRYSGFTKLLFEAYLFYLVIKQGVDKFLILLVSILLGCFLIGQLFLSTNSIFEGILLDEFLKGDIYHLNKYIFIILFVCVLKKAINNLELSQKILEIVTMILIINSVLIILGLFFKINIFKSFPNSTRFGYSGLFSKSGESVLLYLLVSIIFYIRYLKGKSILPVLYFCFIAILSGKKIAFLILGLFYLVHFCVISKNRKYFITFGLSLITCLFLFKDLIIDFLLKQFPFWKQLFYDKGIWTVIFSTRNLSFTRTLNFVNEHWSPINYLFGGTDYNKLRIELDPFDLFVFFGVIGGLAYLFFIKKYFVETISNYIVKLLFIGYVLICMVYGAFLFNILLMSVLYLFSLYCKSFKKELSIDK